MASSFDNTGLPPCVFCGGRQRLVVEDTPDFHIERAVCENQPHSPRYLVLVGIASPARIRKLPESRREKW